MKNAALYHRPPEAQQPRLAQMAADLLAQNLPGVIDAVPAYQSLYIEYDLSQTSAGQVRAWINGYQTGLAYAPANQADPSAITEIPVCYDGEDLPEVAAATGLSTEEVVRLHAGETYLVRALGFVAGFPFMSTTPPALQLPRRATPRAKVPPHSLAIAGAQTGIYPVEAPGGWNLLGRTLVPVYDPNREKPFLVEPGQRVKFRPVTQAAPHLPAPAPRLLWPAEPAQPILHVKKAGAVALLMDEGRAGQGRYGLVRSGVLDTQSARLANDLVGNAPECALLELHMLGPQLECLGAAVLAWAGQGMDALLNGQALAEHASFTVQAGDQLTFRPNGRGRVTYLAVQGGFETRPFLGSASTDLKAGLGRALQAGDVLGQQPGHWDGFHLPRQFIPHGADEPRQVVHLRLIPVADGEVLTPEDASALCQQPFTLRDLDRMAARLTGPPVLGGEITSEACPVGTLQVPPSGEVMILLNDKGTLGGYRRPARVHPADLPRLVQALSGQRLQFVLG